MPATGEGMQERAPYHESVIWDIQEATGTALHWLAQQIKRTKVPRNHDAIIAAWRARCAGLCWGDDLGVEADLLAQKREVEAKEASKKKAEESADAGAPRAI